LSQQDDRANASAFVVAVEASRSDAPFSQQAALVEQHWACFAQHVDRESVSWADVAAWAASLSACCCEQHSCWPWQQLALSEQQVAWSAVAFVPAVNTPTANIEAIVKFANMIDSPWIAHDSPPTGGAHGAQDGWKQNQQFNTKRMPSSGV
jgi:hypothetical protein